MAIPDTPLEMPCRKAGRYTELGGEISWPERGKCIVTPTKLFLLVKSKASNATKQLSRGQFVYNIVRLQNSQTKQPTWALLHVVSLFFLAQEVECDILKRIVEPMIKSKTTMKIPSSTHGENSILRFH
jgi:hypothetical protein